MPLKTLEELVSEAKANVGHISPAEFTEATESIILLDVRDEPDYDKGTSTGSSFSTTRLH